MSWLSDGFDEITKHPLSILDPVFGVPAELIDKFTGLSPTEQLGLGAGIGSFLHYLVPPNPGNILPGTPGAGNSAGGLGGLLGGLFGGNGGGLLGSLFGAGGSYLGAEANADAVRDANERNYQVAMQQMAFSAKQAERQMEFSHSEAQNEMDFQRDMSNTAYQRVTADMKAAGLNPMLAITNGGASTPSGAMGQGASGYSAGANMLPVPSVLMHTISSALDMLRTFADVRKSIAQAEVSETMVPSVQAQTAKTIADVANTKADTSAIQMKNKEILRRQNLEGLNSKSMTGKIWSGLWGLLSSITDRIGFSSNASYNVSKK